MAETNKRSFEVIHFKTQHDINADRRKKLENEREALRKRVAGIWNKGTNSYGTKTHV